MKMSSMKKLLSLIGCMVLVAAMALNFTGCSDSGKTPNPTETPVVTGNPPEASAGETTPGIAFRVVVTDLEGKETTFDYTTDKATVGEALLEEGLIAGDDSEWGLYVTTVNGITADWDNDQTYWAFYIDGEYALTGVDATEVTAGAAYSFVLTKG